MNPLDFVTPEQKRYIIDYLREHDGEDYAELAIYVSLYLERTVTADQLRCFNMDDLLA